MNAPDPIIPDIILHGVFLFYAIPFCVGAAQAVDRLIQGRWYMDIDYPTKGDKS